MKSFTEQLCTVVRATECAMAFNRWVLDGLVPLAYLLEDARLKAKAQKYVDWILNNAAPSGMIGPTANHDWWPRMVAVKALVQYQEATNDPRVIPVIEKYFVYQLDQLPNRPLRDWGKFRAHDEILVVLWLYNRTGNQQLLDLARLLHGQLRLASPVREFPLRSTC